MNFKSIVYLWSIIFQVKFVLSGKLRHPDSIMDMINKDQLARMIDLRNNSSTTSETSSQPNSYLDNDVEEVHKMRHKQHNPVLDLLETTQPQDPDSTLIYNDSVLSGGPDKILKSNKNALFITKKEYLKKDWCNTQPLIQRIREYGCKSQAFVNRFCYGQCNSFFIPKSPGRRRRQNKRGSSGTHLEDEDLTEAAFKSCASCKPRKFQWVTVTLRCPKLTPMFKKKRIQRIQQCKCMSEPMT
ncbi:GREM2 family protein [Megaselia abdita]